MLGERKQDDFLELCQNKLAEYEATTKDAPGITVIDGWEGGGFGINAALARQLQSPVLLCMDYRTDESHSSVVDRAVRRQQTVPASSQSSTQVHSIQRRMCTVDPCSSAFA
jgi:adenine/guanine phosphoribosyltransferase-like PRPP-binding protein